LTATGELLLDACEDTRGAHALARVQPTVAIAIELLQERLLERVALLALVRHVLGEGSGYGEQRGEQEGDDELHARMTRRRARG
jgi:hypothetical protein